MRAYLYLFILPLVVFACSSPAGANIAGTSWTLESLGPTGSETPIVQGSTIRLVFDTNGQVSGSAGCNSYGAKYKIKGGTISFDAISSTLMACLNNDLNQQEQRYLQALQATGRFDVSGGRLKIWYDNGKNALIFR